MNDLKQIYFGGDNRIQQLKKHFSKLSQYTQRIVINTGGNEILVKEALKRVGLKEYFFKIQGKNSYGIEKSIRILTTVSNREFENQNFKHVNILKQMRFF